MEKKDLGKTSIGLQANIAALLSYALGFISGIIFYLIEKENKFVRFHAMQSIVIFGSLTVIQIANRAALALFLPWGISNLISTLVGLVGLILWIVLMIKAYQGELFKIPIAGDIAEKKS